MEKCKRVHESGEIVLPEAIIHHIQSFMTGKEAAQTSILSKHWYTAWSTRPNLDFNYCDFPIRDNHFPVQFKEFVKKTFQRYEELNLTIESISLCVSWWETRRLLLFNELIMKAMQMGATDIKLQLIDPNQLFSLPKELLVFENLVRLSAIGCTIDLGVNGKVSWSRLKSLSLQKVCFEGDVIWDIILSCRLIEELLLSECSFKVLNSNHIRLRRMLTLSTNLFELRTLKCLSLKRVKIDTSFFSNLFKFPCLKDLTVDDCFGYKAITISSPSLERISFAVKKKMLRANFEVPCLRKFTFSGLDLLPSLSFGTSSSFMWKWESDISVTCWSNRNGLLTTLWFLKLREFLVDLSPSRISLTLSIRTICEDNVGDIIQGLCKPPIDNLRLVLMGAPSSVCSALLNGLFSSCRPELISFTGKKADTAFLELLCGRLLVTENGRIPNQCTIFGRLSDLKGVIVEFYDENLSEWRPPLSSKALLDDYPENKQNIRLKLIWG